MTCKIHLLEAHFKIFPLLMVFTLLYSLLRPLNALTSDLYNIPNRVIISGYLDAAEFIRSWPLAWFIFSVFPPQLGLV